MLPNTIYHTFTRYQSMRRHMEDTYNLSQTERKRLLDHYHQAQGSDTPLKGHWVMNGCY